MGREVTVDTDPRSGFSLITPLRVRYGEADMQGIVFNANYLSFADVGITEYFRALREKIGATDSASDLASAFGGDNWARHAEVDFRGPARADDLLDICVRVARFGRTSYTAQIHIVRDETLLTVIHLTYVWFDPATQQIVPIAQPFIDAVNAYETNLPVIEKRP